MCQGFETAKQGDCIKNVPMKFTYIGSVIDYNYFVKVLDEKRFGLTMRPKFAV